MSNTLANEDNVNGISGQCPRLTSYYQICNNKENVDAVAMLNIIYIITKNGKIYLNVVVMKICISFKFKVEISDVYEGITKWVSNIISVRMSYRPCETGTNYSVINLWLALEFKI